MAQKKQKYNEQSITSLKGAERVRKRPSVVFGSDGLTAVSSPPLR